MCNDIDGATEQVGERRQHDVLTMAGGCETLQRIANAQTIVNEPNLKHETQPPQQIRLHVRCQIVNGVFRISSEKKQVEL